jgi:hypothetical protein
MKHLVNKATEEQRNKKMAVFSALMMEAASTSETLVNLY